MRGLATTLPTLSESPQFGTLLRSAGGADATAYQRGVSRRAWSARSSSSSGPVTDVDLAVKLEVAYPLEDFPTGAPCPCPLHVVEGRVQKTEVVYGITSWSIFDKPCNASTAHASSSTRPRSSLGRAATTLEDSSRSTTPCGVVDQGLSNRASSSGTHPCSPSKKRRQLPPRPLGEVGGRRRYDRSASSATHASASS